MVIHVIIRRFLTFYGPKCENLMVLNLDCVAEMLEDFIFNVMSGIGCVSSCMRARITVE
jgi:hypothetical protein